MNVMMWTWGYKGCVSYLSWGKIMVHSIASTWAEWRGWYFANLKALFWIAGWMSGFPIPHKLIQLSKTCLNTLKNHKVSEPLTHLLRLMMRVNKQQVSFFLEQQLLPRRNRILLLLATTIYLVTLVSNYAVDYGMKYCPLIDLKTLTKQFSGHQTSSHPKNTIRKCVPR